MQQYYTLKVAGLTRQLPLCAVSDKLDIAAFIMFSDVELTVACAKDLVKIAPPCDVLITAESKGIPLAYEMARQMDIPYVVARKSVKVYTIDPIEVTVNSITTQNPQKLYLGRDEVELLKGKRVLIVDDVISTGESLKALETLVERAGGKIVGQAAVLAAAIAALVVVFKVVVGIVIQMLGQCLALFADKSGHSDRSRCNGRRTCQQRNPKTFFHGNQSFLKHGSQFERFKYPQAGSKERRARKLALFRSEGSACPR